MNARHVTSTQPSLEDAIRTYGTAQYMAGKCAGSGDRKRQSEWEKAVQKARNDLRRLCGLTAEETYL